MKEVATLCVWPAEGKLNVLVGSHHYTQTMKPKQMLWLAEKFVNAANEQLRLDDLERREQAARET
jgi:hypothetical protein